MIEIEEHFDVYLVSFSGDTLNGMKVIREFTKMSPYQAKASLSSLPLLLAEDISSLDIFKIQKAFQEFECVFKFVKRT